MQAQLEKTATAYATASEQRSSLDTIMTPAAIVDVRRMRANLDGLASYAAEHGLALRPHIKTHKVPALAREQLVRGAAGLTVATPHEAEVMSSVCTDLLMAYPPVGEARLARLMRLPANVRLAVALDSLEVMQALAAAARSVGRTVYVRVEIDAGMRRVGVPRPEEAVTLARAIAEEEGVEYEGVNVYAGHIRQPVDEQGEALDQLNRDLGTFIDALHGAGLPPRVVSGGSTPTAFQSHLVPAMTEIRPGTYIFNDRITAGLGACSLDDCAYTVLATVVSTAVPGQAVVDAGAKAVNREEIKTGGHGYGVLLDRPEVVLVRMSEEHGVLDLSRTDWQPRIGERVRIVPNHVCISVNLHARLWPLEDGRLGAPWPVAARGWDGGR